MDCNSDRCQLTVARPNLTREKDAVTLVSKREERKDLEPQEELARELQKSNLKNQALLEKISTLVAQYENQVADLRVQLTLQEHDNKEVVNSLNSEVDTLRYALSEKDDDVQEEAAEEDSSN